jgi:PKD repeat protein
VPTGYLKSGTVLATVPDQSAPFTPTLAQWRTDTIDLGAFLGQDVIIRFANINGYGNRLYIGNVRVNGSSLAIQAGISSTTSAVCAGSTVTYSFAGLGSPTSYQWNFGTGATPATANTAGPHQVTYATPGSAAVELIVSDGTNADTATINTAVEGPLLASFGYTQGGSGTLQFNDQSSGPATAWYWDFGNGNTSTQQNPTSQYFIPGPYLVTFAALNSCGWDTSTATVFVVSLQEGASHPWKLFPNPAQEVLNLDGFEGELHYTISNAMGQNLSTGVIQSSGNKAIDVSEFPSGAYVITLNQGQQTRTIPWLKR